MTGDDRINDPSRQTNFVSTLVPGSDLFQQTNLMCYS